MLPSQSVRPLQLALLGNGLTPHGPASTEIHGRDVATGLARSVQVDTAAVRDAIHTPLTAVLDGIGKVLRDCPPDLVADLADRGIMMVGGSALLPGLDQMLRDATGMPVHIAERPDVCAVLGLGAMLEGKIQPLVLDPLAGSRLRAGPGQMRHAQLAVAPVAARSAIRVLDWATPASRLSVRSRPSSSAGSAALARTR